MVIEKMRNITNAATNSTSTNVTATNSACLASAPLLIDEHKSTIGNGEPSNIANQTLLNATSMVGSAPSVLQTGTTSIANAGVDKNSLAFTTKTPLASQTITNLHAISTGFDGGKHGDNGNENNNSSGNVFGNIYSDTITDAETCETEDSLYECNICLDTAEDAVVSMCGHLFCWPCLQQLLKTKPNRKQCPVCKACVDKDKVIPLFGRNCVNKEDPRYKLPPRTAGQQAGFTFTNRFLKSFEIGSLPFASFTSLNFGSRRTAATSGTTQLQDEETLSKLFLFVAFICMCWILFA